MNPIVLLDAGNTILELNYAVIGEVMGVGADTVRRAEWKARARLDTPELVKKTDDGDRWWMFFSFIAQEIGLRDRAAIVRANDRLKAYDAAGNIWDVPVEGVFCTLGELKREYRLGVVSNSTKPVRPLLERLKLADYFESITDSFTFGVEKPDPKIFLAAAEAMGAAPADCVYVGDIFHVDVLGARAAGMTGVLLDPTGERTEACPKIASLAELPHWLERHRADG